MLIELQAIEVLFFVIYLQFLPCLRGGAVGGGVLPALLVVPSIRNPHGHQLRRCCVRPIAAGTNELHFQIGQSLLIATHAV